MSDVPAGYYASKKCYNCGKSPATPFYENIDMDSLPDSYWYCEDHIEEEESNFWHQVDMADMADAESCHLDDD